MSRSFRADTITETAEIVDTACRAGFLTEPALCLGPLRHIRKRLQSGRLVLPVIHATNEPLSRQCVTDSCNIRFSLRTMIVRRAQLNQTLRRLFG